MHPCMHPPPKQNGRDTPIEIVFLKIRSHPSPPSNSKNALLYLTAPQKVGQPVGRLVGRSAVRLVGIILLQDLSVFFAALRPSTNTRRRHLSRPLPPLCPIYGSTTNWSSIVDHRSKASAQTLIPLRVQWDRVLMLLLLLL